MKALEIKTIQCGKAAIISSLLSGKIEKYEYLTGEE